MPLKNGIYTISTLLDNLPVGVDPVNFPGPKRVIILPANEQKALWARWTITKKDGSNVYKLTVNLDTAVRSRAGDTVMAVPDGYPGEEREWVVERQEVHGEHIYTITSSHRRGEGWFLQSADPFTQVNVQPLIVTPSSPPRYIPNEIFKIVSIDK